MRGLGLIGCVLLGAASPAWANETITYSYDEQGRLTTVVHTGSINNNQTASYTFTTGSNPVNPNNPDNRVQLQVTNAPH